MTGPELAAIRQRLGLTQEQCGRAIGIEGTRNAIEVTISRYEGNIVPIPPTRAAMLSLLADNPQALRQRRRLSAKQVS